MEPPFDQVQVLLRYEDPGEFLLGELQSLYDNSCSSERLNCDIKLFGKDQMVIYAHSTVLASVSPFIKLLLSDVWDPYQGASIILPEFCGADIQNLVQFLYTGKASLTEKEFEVFQQLICELQIMTEGNKAIILEEISPIIQNNSFTSNLLAKEDEKRVTSLENKFYEKTFSCSQFPEISSSKVDGPIIFTEHPYSCQFCPAMFKDQHMLWKHKETQHPRDSLFQITEDCEEGDESASEIIIDEVELILEEDCNTRRTKSTLNCEMKSERPYKCQMCDKAYPVKATLTSHLRLHAEDKPHQCERCGKSFLIRSLLEQHLRTHTDERPFACNVCGKAFRNQSNLIGHKKIHATDRPHLCGVCQKSFNRRHDLDAHLRIHSGEKPFPCSLCSKAFRFRSALRVHLKGVHKTNT